MKKSTILAAIYTAAMAMLSSATLTEQEERLVLSFYSILRDRLDPADWDRLAKIIEG